MLDYYSCCPAPKPEAAVNCVTKGLLDAGLSDPTGLKYTETQIRSACQEALNDMGGEEALGSQSGWLTFFRLELVKRTKARLLQQANTGQIDTSTA